MKCRNTHKHTQLLTERYFISQRLFPCTPWTAAALTSFVTAACGLQTKNSSSVIFLMFVFFCSFIPDEVITGENSLRRPMFTDPLNQELTDLDPQFVCVNCSYKRSEDASLWAKTKEYFQETVIKQQKQISSLAQKVFCFSTTIIPDELHWSMRRLGVIRELMRVIYYSYH